MEHCSGHRRLRRARLIRLGIISLAFELISTVACAQPNLASVVIRGSTIYDAPALFAVYGEHLGKPVTTDSAQAIAAALLVKYETDGYSRPQLKLDDSLLAVGVLRVDVREPRITEVRVSGDPGPHRAQLESLGSELCIDGPIRQTMLDTTLRRMRALPGNTASTRRW